MSENKQKQGTDLFISDVAVDQIGKNFVMSLIINLVKLLMVIK